MQDLGRTEQRLGRDAAPVEADPRITSYNVCYTKLLRAADIIFLVLIIGGLVGIMNTTGAFNAGINWLALRLKGKEYLLIIFVTLLIALGGTTFGLAEETIAFYPILIPVFLAARYDAMVALASIYRNNFV